MGLGFLLAACILLTAAAGFFVGKTVSDRYHDQKSAEIKDALQRQYVRLVAGSDADDPVQPYLAPPRRNIVDQQFMKHLHQNGKATKQVG